MLVSESLDQFLNEYRGFTREEDRWADRELDRYEKRKSGVVLEEDPAEILSDPYDLTVPTEAPEIKKMLYKLIEFKQNDEVSPAEFKNFCIWVTQATENPQEAATIISVFIEKIPALTQALEAETKLSPDGGAYREAFEVISDKYKPKGQDPDYE